MNARRKFLSAVLAAALVLVARPGRAGDARSYLELKVKLTQPALADGSVKLAPGTYDVQVTRSADGSVRAGFFQGGMKRGEARGIIAVRKAGGEKTHTFASLGFNSSSPSSLKQNGQQLSLEIGDPGTNQILVGLLQPAPQKR